MMANTTGVLYSVRNASTGSTVVARCAGRNVAASTIVKSPNDTMAYVSTSVDDTPNSSDWRTRLIANAPTKPIAMQ